MTLKELTAGMKVTVVKVKVVKMTVVIATVVTVTLVAVTVMLMKVEVRVKVVNDTCQNLTGQLCSAA